MLKKRNIRLCFSGAIMFILFVQTFATQATDEINETMNIEEASAWELGIGVGFGKRDNIIINSDNIDIDAFINIAYFGEKFFFDNGDIGYFVTDNTDWNINLIVGANSERQFFEKLNNFGIDITNTTLNSDTGETETHDTSFEIEPTDRDTPIDAGIEIIGDGEWGNLQLQINTDISNKHNGFEVWGGYSKKLTVGNLEFRSSIGFIYKSSQWTNYFYGIRPSEVMLAPNNIDYILPPYQATASTNYFYKFTMNYPLTDKLKIVALFEREYLGKSVRNSPIVNKNEFTTQFMGLFYEF